MINGLTVDGVISKHTSGDLAGAEQGYRILISQRVEHPLMYLNLAAICLQTGRSGEALELLQLSMNLESTDPRLYLNFSAAFLDLERWDDAVTACHKTLQLDPHCAPVHQNLGQALDSMGRYEEAVSAYQKAIEIAPHYFEAFLNLGNALMKQGKAQDAIASFSRAIELNPNYCEAYLNLGNAFGDNYEQAVACFLKALEISPCYPEGHNNLGNALLAQGKLEEAATAFQRAIELNPHYGQAYYNLGLVRQEQRNAVAADRCFRKAIELIPDFADAHTHLGFALRQQDRLDEAMDSYAREVELRTEHLQRKELVRKVGLLLTQLERIPVIYKAVSDIDSCRDQFIGCLHEVSRIASLEARALSLEERAILKGILFRINNFYLAYQQMNDRELQISYSRLASGILEPEMSPYLNATSVSHSKDKIRLGVASGNLRNHNGSFWAYHWLDNLPRDDYEFYLYSLRGVPDEVTGMFAELGTYRWFPFRETDYLDALRTIREDNLDVLVLPDVGMSPLSRIISLARLAPVQCVAWGHPVTTGSPNIDYYLSSDLMESADADRHYSEMLVRLPNTGMHFKQPAPPAEVLGRADFGIPDSRVAYASVQSLFKYLPQHDFVYPEIARQVPDALFIFVGDHSYHVTNTFRERLRKAFEQANLNFEHYVKILPQLPYSQFMRLLCVVDINLDSIGWSGGITTMNSLAMDCPVVTLPGEFMRGRHSYAMLKMIGVEELIVDSLDDYVTMSARLGRDRILRSAIVEKIKAQKHKLFDDMECIEYLDSFFKSKVAVVRESTGAPVAAYVQDLRNPAKPI